MLVQHLDSLRPFFALPKPGDPLDLSTWQPPASDTPSPDPPIHPSTDPVFVCVDVEAWELNQSVITEIGIATLDVRAVRHLHPGAGAHAWLAKIQSEHVIIAEHAQHVNTKYVQGCPDKFLFGTSRWASLAEAQQLLQRAIAGGAEQRPVALVAHGLRGDRKYMAGMGVDLAAAGARTIVMDVDTQRLCSPKKLPARLSRLLDAVGVRYSYLHNAGNDAAFTMQALVRMVFLDAFEPAAFQERIAPLRVPPVKVRKKKWTRKAKVDGVVKDSAAKTDGGSAEVAA